MIETGEAKHFRWNSEKDEWLKAERGVSFDEIVRAIADPKRLIGVGRNRSPRRATQFIFIVDIDGYPWVVPFVERPDSIFLKTAYPSRRMKHELDQALKGGEAD